jgi:hypothetical protein
MGLPHGYAFLAAVIFVHSLFYDPSLVNNGSHKLLKSRIFIVQAPKSDRPYAGLNHRTGVS